MRVALMGLVLLLSCGITGAHAQQRQFGGKVGPTIATLLDEVSDENEDTITGCRWERRFVVLLWVVARQCRSRRSSLRRRKAPPETDDVTATLILDYIEVPLLGRVTANRSSSASFHVFVGPSAGVRINAKQQVAYSGGVIRSGYSDDISSEIARFELGLVAGGGVDVGRYGVIDARYFWGLTDVNRNASDGNRVRNRGLTILAGLRF